MSITTGIMTFTPDGRPFCGKMPNLEGLFHCAGFSGHGIVQSPTIGVVMAELILDGKSTYDVSSIDADRYFDLPSLQKRSDIESKCGEMEPIVQPCRRICRARRQHLSPAVPRLRSCP